MVCLCVYGGNKLCDLMTCDVLAYLLVLIVLETTAYSRHVGMSNSLLWAAMKQFICFTFMLHLCVSIMCFFLDKHTVTFMGNYFDL